MRNICILKLEKNENGFFIAGQTAESACLRSWLKLNGINSMIYMDDTLPSLNDLAEDVLSVCEDILAIYINEENKVLADALAYRLRELEDIDIVFLSGSKPEEVFYGLLPESSNKELSIMEVSPYEQKILFAQDAERYGIWYGRENESGIKEYRSQNTIKTDIDLINQAYSGLAKDNKKLIPCEGTYIKDSEYLHDIVKLLPAAETPLCFICPVEENLIDELPDLETVLWKIQLTGENEAVLSESKLSELISSEKVYSIHITENASKKLKQIPKSVLEAAQDGKLIIEIDENALAQCEAREELLLRSSARRYIPFSRGFLKSRTGVYTGVPLDGYVKHIEVEGEDMNEAERKCLNELAGINSSVYLKKGELSFSQFREKNMDAHVIESNLLRIEQDRLIVNDLAYRSPQKIKEIPYNSANDIIEEMAQQFGTPQASFYIFTMETAEDYEAFLRDAEIFREKHTFEKMPLAFGYLKNYCRFLNSNSCLVDKMPRIQLKGDGNVYVCSNFEEPVGTCSQAIFELTQSCYVKKENTIKERGCVSCIARSWCAKCTQMPDFIQKSYCHVMKSKTYVIDYLMASIVYIDMSSTVPVLKSVKPQDVKVTSEYMFNLTDSKEKGKEMPYFPKFSYMFNCEEKGSVLWSAASAKFFRISSQFALVCEMLFKRLSTDAIMENMQDILKIEKEEAIRMFNSISDTLNKSGAMYRPVDGSEGGGK
ncbi:MAG: hypothetical protein ACLVLG_06580 [Anaerovoracaceae bacterium]